MPRKFRKFKLRNFILREISNLCENLHQRKFPAIRYLCTHAVGPSNIMYYSINRWATFVREKHFATKKKGVCVCVWGGGGGGGGVVGLFLRVGLLSRD